MNFFTGSNPNRAEGIELADAEHIKISRERMLNRAWHKHPLTRGGFAVMVMGSIIFLIAPVTGVIVGTVGGIATIAGIFSKEKKNGPH